MPKDITVLWPDFSVTTEHRIGVTRRCPPTKMEQRRESPLQRATLSPVGSCCAFSRHNASFLGYGCGMVALRKPLRTMSC
jgi:hypothetical protein